MAMFLSAILSSARSNKVALWLPAGWTTFPASCTIQGNILGVYLHTCLDGALFNVQWFQARMKVINNTITDLLFADDISALATHT